MKNFHANIKAFICIIFLIVIIPMRVQSQTVPSLLVVVEFMKVKQEDHSKYLEVEQEIWKPMHRERINQGIIAGWYLYAVEFSGTSDAYNYVVITLYDNSENLENPWRAEIPEQVHKDMTLAQIMERTNSSREVVMSRLYYSVATAPEIPLENPAQYMAVNYMKVEPGMQAEYEQLESEVWLPIHNQSIQSGRTMGWGLWRTLFPRGADQDYQYITLNTFSEYSYIFDLDFSIPFEKIHPQMDFSEIATRTQEVRIITRTELWDLIEYEIR